VRTLPSHPAILFALPASVAAAVCQAVRATPALASVAIAEVVVMEEVLAMAEAVVAAVAVAEEGIRQYGKEHCCN
jgi:hypothetical protein